MRGEKMRIAISTDNGYVSAHFGRCPAYTLVDIEEGQVLRKEEIANPGHSPGFLPRFLAERDVKIVIAGGMGPRAQSLFAENKIEVISGVQGKVDEVIERFIRNELSPGEDLCEHESEGDQHQFHHEHESDRALLQPGKPGPTGKICITSRGSDLDSEVEEVFGRAAYFIFVNPETMEIEVYQNPAKDQAHGAGIQSAQLMAEKGVTALFTGQIGPNARRVVEAAGIQIRLVGGGTVKDIVNGLREN